VPPRRLTLFPLLLLFAFAAPASAQDDPRSRSVAGVFQQGLDQTVYKGLVGNVLDAVPMHPSDRLDLQRTNAVVSNTLFGRSLAVLAGLSNPVLLLGGFVWGMWAASNIKMAEAGMIVDADAALSGGAARAQERMVALLDGSSAADDAPANTVPKLLAASSAPAGDADPAAPARPRVIKIWLAQRAPMLPR